MLVVVQLQLLVYIVPHVLQLSRGGRRHSQPVFLTNNSVSVDCLMLLGLGVTVGWFEVVGAMVVSVESAAEEACARRG